MLHSLAGTVQEIMSYIKGSAEALSNPSGKLSLEQYLEVGHKRAPNFTNDTRRQAYVLYLQYEREKTRLYRCAPETSVSSTQAATLHQIRQVLRQWLIMHVQV